MYLMVTPSVFRKSEFIAGNLALDFANTVHSHGAPDPDDDLRTFSDLVTWSREAGVLSERECRQLLRHTAPNSAEQHFKHLRQLRELIYRMFSDIAGSANAPPETVEQFNAFLRNAMAQASIQRVGDKYALGWRRNSSPVGRILFELTRSATALLTAGRLERVRQCAGENCTWLFLDTSRNGLRRWCDMRACGNRAKVRRFRQHAPSFHKE